MERNLTIKSSDEIRDEKGIYNLQLIVYMLGIKDEYLDYTITSGIINLKNISEGVLEGKYGGNSSLSSNELENYKNEIILIIKKILDKDILLKN